MLKNLFKSEETKGDLSMYVIYDSKSRSYSAQPGYSHNDETAIRDFINMLSQDPKNQLFQNAEDYSLFKIGWYTKKTGTVELQNHTHVINFHDIREIVKAKWTQISEDVMRQTAATLPAQSPEIQQ